MQRRQFLATIPFPFLRLAAAQAVTWERRADLPVGRSETPAATLDGLIYVAGGFGAGARADRYDSHADEWEQIADLPVETNHPGIATYQDQVVVAGGYSMDGASAHSGMWAYKNDSETWELIGELPEPMGAFGLVSAGDDLYLVGGALGSLNGEPSAGTWRWAPSDGTWEERAPLAHAREHLAVVSLNGSIYAIGGRAHGLDSDELGGAVERYDPTSDTWEPEESLPHPRSGLNGAAVCNSVIVAGGETSSAVFADAQVLEPGNGSWRSLPDLPVAVHGVAVGVSETFVFAIGGSTAAGRIQNIADVYALDLSNLVDSCGE